MAGAVALVVASVLSFTLEAGAQGDDNGTRGISVVQVEGLLDPPTASLLQHAIEDANEQRRTMLVVQLDSRGAVDVDVQELVRAITQSKVPVIAWAGPSGGEAKGAATLLLQASHQAFVAQGASVGPGHPVRLDEPDAQSTAAVAAELGRLAERNGRDPEGAARLATKQLSPAEARAAGAVDGVRPTLGEVVVSMDGKTVTTVSGDHTLNTARVIGEGRDRRRQPNQDVVFDGMGLGAQVQHGLIRPSVAYFLFIAGLALIVFEFFAISIGLVGLAGAVATVGACYGFSHLPVHWWAVGLLVFGVLGLSIDVQAGGLGPWTVIGTLALIAGSLFLYGGAHLDVPWWVLILVIGLAVLFFVWGMTAAVRARFSTPTVGREGMVGRMGTAEVPVAPDGIVMIDGARWRARTNRATPIAAGDAVRVVEIEGLVLEVEPEEGGAEDYREKYRERKRRREERREEGAAGGDPDGGDVGS
jgi:membrane-bound serine protease (ClpP class)